MVKNQLSGFKSYIKEWFNIIILASLLVITPGWDIDA